jgi:RNA polymerase sigma-70 factor (ECF subfamily)
VNATAELAVDWTSLYEECHSSLFRTAVVLVGTAGAEDLVQETFERAVRSRDFPAVVEPRAWLRTVLVRLGISTLRRRRLALRHLFGSQPLEPSSDPRVLDLRAALSRLPPRQRAAVVLRYYHDSDYNEIAEVTGLAADSIGPLLSRARTALREVLE